MAQVVGDLVIRPRNQDARRRVARDRRLVLLVLRERQPVVKVDVHIRARLECGAGRGRNSGSHEQRGRHESESHQLLPSEVWRSLIDEPQSVEYFGCTFSPRIAAIALLAAIAASPMPTVMSVIFPS